MNRAAYALICFFMIASLANGQSLTDFEKKVTEFTLDSGLKFIVIERHEAPVVSFFTYADVGSVNEVTGITGLAHIFEHMAFKGSKTVGTKDLAKELELMQKEDEAFELLRAERAKGRLADPQQLEKLEQEFEAAKQAAQEWANSKEFDEAVERAGGVGLNASTDSDSTQYYYSLPSNKIELWYSLESDRFTNPVLREFYVEKDVVMEERRLRVESNPTGRLVEEFLAAAYKAHPYGDPTVGHMSDLQSISRAEAESFFKEYYGPDNLIIAIAGDVSPGKAKELAQKYFSRLSDKAQPEPVETIEPEQQGERRITVEDPAQPLLLVGYHTPDFNHPDRIISDVLLDIAGRGRASRLYKSLVKQKRIAISTSGFSGFPGAKYPSLITFFAVPTRGHTTEECEAALYEEIDKLKKEPVSENELKKAKTRARADLIRQLGSNTGIAGQLAFYEAMTGDWRNLFRDLDRINAVSAQDIQRMAQQYLIPRHRTVAVTKTTAAPKPEATSER